MPAYNIHPTIIRMSVNCDINENVLLLRDPAFQELVCSGFSLRDVVEYADDEHLTFRQSICR